MSVRLSAVLLAAASAMVPSSASAAYVDAHVTAVSARVEVARDGTAVLTHDITYHVNAGALRSFTVAALDGGWRPHPTTAVTSASVTPGEDHALHVTVDEPKGLKHGDYRFELVYEGTVQAVHDGALDRIWLTLPAVREGLDSTRVVFSIPAAPTEPRAATDGDSAQDVTTVHRGPDHDEIELVRPHIAKGDAATFSVRVDPKALHVQGAALPQVGPLPAAATTSPSAPSTRTTLLASIYALAVLALALLKKELLGAQARGLVPGSGGARAACAALLAFGSVIVEPAWGELVSAGLVVLALPLLAWRFSPGAPKGPSLDPWRARKVDEALATERSRADWLDATTLRGALLLGAACSVVTGVCWWRRTAPDMPALVLVSATLAPVFLTGTRKQMPGRFASALAPISNALSARDDLGVLATESGVELRLLVTPRVAMPGALGIEVAVVWETLGMATVPWLDVLVRVRDDTFASQRMTTAFPRRRVLPGRHPEERVYRFAPDWPTGGSVVARVAELADVLRDRRFHVASAKLERRLPPNQRAVAHP